MIHRNRMFLLTPIVPRKLHLNDFTEHPHELFSAFSVYKNGKKLFDTRRGQSTSIIHCLPGLRTLAMLHIMLGRWKHMTDANEIKLFIFKYIVGHRYGWFRGFPNINTNDYAVDGKWQRTLWSAVVNIHPIAVDCFFVLGGCLLARSILIAIEK